MAWNNPRESGARQAKLWKYLSLFVKNKTKTDHPIPRVLLTVAVPRHYLGSVFAVILGRTYERDIQQPSLWLPWFPLAVGSVSETVD